MNTRVFSIPLIIFVLGLISSNSSMAQPVPADINPACPDANVFTNVIDQICWDCFLDDFSLYGVGSPPDGASSELNLPVCACSDALGIPEFGFPIGSGRRKKSMRL